MFGYDVRPHPFTRRRALTLAAGAAAATALRPAAPAWACAPAFEAALGDVSSRGWRTLPPVRAPRRFDLVGIRWARAAGLEVEVRARRARGEWTRWARLPVHRDHAPDGAGAPTGTEPCWTGSADFLQVRLRGRASGLRARFVRAAPAARAAGRSARASSTRSRQAQAGMPPIITRAEWGGDSCPPRTKPDLGEVQVAFVHHTVSANDYTAEESRAIVLGICRYHRDHNKWNDLGYNFLVDRYGQIFEGRAGGIDQAVVGAQAQGYNAVSTGIACIGDFSSIPQSEAGVESVARLIAWKLSLHGAPVTGEVTVTSAGGETNRYPSGTAVRLQRISGHRDGNRTACPGDGLYGQMAAIRARAAQLATPVSALTLRADRTRVKAPAAVRLSGTLRFADGSSAAGAQVQVQHQAAGAAWSTLTTVAASGDGTWSASVAPPASGLLRAYFPGDGARGALTARTVRVTVVPRLTLKLASNRIRRGQRTRVTGTVGPTWPPRVELVLERSSGRRWVVEQRKRINVRGGRFATWVRPRRAGLYRVTIKAPGGSIRRRLRSVDITGGASADV